jgi:hypothetical protein
VTGEMRHPMEESDEQTTFYDEWRNLAIQAEIK